MSGSLLNLFSCTNKTLISHSGKWQNAFNQFCHWAHSSRQRVECQFPCSIHWNTAWHARPGNITRGVGGKQPCRSKFCWGKRFHWDSKCSSFVKAAKASCTMYVKISCGFKVMKFKASLHLSCTLLPSISICTTRILCANDSFLMVMKIRYRQRLHCCPRRKRIVRCSAEFAPCTSDLWLQFCLRRCDISYMGPGWAWSVVKSMFQVKKS